MTQICSPTMLRFCALLLCASPHGARSRATATKSRLAYGRHSLQLFQQRQPAIERLPSGSKRRIKEDFIGPDFGVAPDILADLFERTGESRPVLAQWLVGNLQDRMNNRE
jgi:hypothetical protein